jgi:hypothetical protein
MTRFEEMLLEKIDAINTVVVRLDERVKNLEAYGGPLSARRAKTKFRDGGLILSGGTASAVLSLVLNHFAPVPPQPPPQPPPPAIAAPARTGAP